MNLYYYFISVVVISIHSFMNFNLSKKLGYSLRFQKASLYITCLLNGIIGSFFLFTKYDNPMTQYIICMIILVGELFVLFRGRLTSILGVVFGSLIHLYVLRAFIVAGGSIMMEISMYEVNSNSLYFSHVNLLSFAAQIITLLLFTYLMPLKIVRKIMDDKNFYMSLFGAAVLISVYLIYNTYMFTIDYYSINLAVQEIMIAIFALMFLYILMFLLIRIFNLGVYKKKTQELEVKIDKNEAITQSLRKKAETDSLTGAYNKAAFAIKVDKMLQNNDQGALYMFDLDNFKGVNDNMGHALGDEVLRDVYEKAVTIFRPTDMISRAGGDEFLVFLPGNMSKEIIEKKAIQICDALNKTYHGVDGISIEVSCSVGISVAPRDGKDFETLFKLADEAMYQSKKTGKNTYTFHK